MERARATASVLCQISFEEKGLLPA